MPRSPTTACLLASLPAELIDSILSYLCPVDLAAVSATCRILYELATADSHWHALIQENVPGVRLTTSYPFPCYRDLYAAHDTKWFLPKYKIWFCDRDLVGKLLIARYDQRRGCIEAYQLVAVSKHANVDDWAPPNNPVTIHTFEPQVSLHQDKPVLKFAAAVNPESRRAPELSLARDTGFAPEVPMVVDENPDTMYCNFLLTTPMQPDEAALKEQQPFPYGYLWPPPTIPGPHRVIGSPSFHDDEHPHMPPCDLPTRRSEASDRIFRVKQWIEMPGSLPAGMMMLGQGMTTMVQALTGQNIPGSTDATAAWDPFVGLPGLEGVHLGEEIITYSTLDPALYTPTPLKPWRGIYVGDYSGHGCEFLLVHQPDDDDDPPVSDEDLGLVRREGEPEADWERRRYEKRVYRGRLEAIKLTGDPNVPRGEHTFVAENIGDGGYVSEMDNSPFPGARVVNSKGHIARTGFEGSE